MHGKANRDIIPMDLEGCKLLVSVLLIWRDWDGGVLEALKNFKRLIPNIIWSGCEMPSDYNLKYPERRC